MKEDGIPCEKISLLHSKQYDPNYTFNNPDKDAASEKATDQSDLRQFVLMTHAKLHLGFNEFDYDLIIYDEALMLGTASSLNLEDVISAVAGAVARTEVRPNASDDILMLSLWLSEVQELIMKAGNNDLLQIPSLPLSIGDCRKAIKAIVKGDNTITKLLDLAILEQPIRIVKEGHQGSHLIHIKQTIPDHLNNMVILDAGFKYSELMKFSNSLKTSNFSSDIKSHNCVTLHTCEARSGRQEIMGLLKKSDTPKVFQEVAHVAIKLLKQGRNVLCFTFKDQGSARPVEALKAEMEIQLGHSLELLEDAGEFHCVTWGYETALNNFSHCDAVLFAGLLTLPTPVIYGKACAQAGDITVELSDEELKKVTQSVKVNSIYQALNRGSCRIMSDGEANHMDAYVFSHDHKQIREALQTMMPDLKVKKHVPKYEQVKKSQKSVAKEIILEFLSSFQGDQISSKKLFNNIPNIHVRTLREALKELLDNELVFVWDRPQRSLVRSIG
jgi:hypothetical protein